MAIIFDDVEKINYKIDAINYETHSSMIVLEKNSETIILRSLKDFVIKYIYVQPIQPTTKDNLISFE